MPWSYRKSIKAGPFRVNLSKSGVGYSVGGKAIRYGKTAKGRSYVSSSPLPGVRYQQTLSTPTSRARQTAPLLPMRAGPSPEPVGSPQQRMSQGRLALIIVGAVLCLVLVFALVGAATKTTPTPTSTPRPTTTTTTVAAAAVLASTIAATPRPAPTNTPVPTPTSLAPTATPAPPTPQTVTVTSANAANVRSGPNTDADVLSQVLPGNDATVIDADVPSDAGDSRWVRVSVNGMEGYIRKDLVGAPHAVLAVAPVSSAPTAVATPARPSATATSSVVLLASPPGSPNRVASSGVVVTVLSDGTGEKINIRSDPDMSAPVLTQVNERDELPLYDTSDTMSADTLHWLKVTLAGAIGYVRRDLVSGPHAASGSIPTAVPSVRPAAPSGSSGYSRPATGFYTDSQGRVRPITSSGGRHK